MKVKVLVGTATVLALVWGGLMVNAVSEPIKIDEPREKAVHVEAIEAPIENVPEPTHEDLKPEVAETLAETDSVDKSGQLMISEWRGYLSDMARTEMGNSVIQCLEGYNGDNPSAKTRTSKWMAFSDGEKDHYVRSYYAQTLILLAGRGQEFADKYCSR